ncbi:hypothetical protein PPYR_02840 [Photinus pyralis]|uniref:Uncharacterized protein n=1 Tax=Photinus pyralis TaxID=7054 RepID=A0A5N4A147_PHOPY|nr:hypothetical protein PPYR_02840 [Photinus pyralis]
MRSLEGMRQLARDSLVQAFEDQRKYYNLRRRPYRPQVGQKIYCREHTLSDKGKGVMSKLTPKYSGPYEIKKIISPVIVEVCTDQKRRRYQRVHVKDIKPVDADLPGELEEEGDPLQVRVEGETAQIDQNILSPVSSLAMAPVRRSLRQRRAVRRVNPWCPRRFHPDPATPKATVRKFSGPMVSPMVRKVEQLVEKFQKLFGSPDVTHLPQGLGTPPQIQAAALLPSPTLSSGEGANRRMPSPVGNFQRPDEDFQYNAPPWEGSPLFSLEVAAWLPSPTPDIMEACGEVAMTHGIEALPTASAVMEFIKENLTGMEYASEYADNTFHQPEIPLQEQQRKQQGLTRRQRRNRRRVSIAVEQNQCFLLILLYLALNLNFTS